MLNKKAFIISCYQKAWENKIINIPCKCIFLVGEKDRVGKVVAYNREWAKRVGYPLITINDAAHNSNDDNPEEVNRIIREFIISLDGLMEI